MLLLIQPRMLSAFTAARTHCRHVYRAVHQPPQILLFSVELFSSQSVPSPYGCWSKSLSRERLGICPSWISWSWSILLHQILPNFLVVVGFHGRVDDNSTPSLITFYLQMVACEEEMFFAFTSDACLPQEWGSSVVNLWILEWDVRVPSHLFFSQRRNKEKESVNNEFHIGSKV